MRDREARDVINLLNKRIKQLDKEIRMLKNPHPKDCKCNFCEGWTPDHLMITVDKVASKGYYWFEE
jgi:hypothetical protein